ncbi:MULTISPECIES: uroporphyrinogen-III synthase [unclassified Vibrio]|uniref:uroporphyrinogen-III synthase n=1 Tax=unclassified Vibrio TaxID=2614977 RepID=UPI001360D336|nr:MULTISPECIES: uroporphyrinogen-III synthase [unclassified Vibrio]NAW57676.1 uroporphyrinogen-III synthase [Vibrio sp. V36_P2S2PM302]NAX22941.1 uroporphyrinogen-III synthase [Vibrio sp. V39_P1S14PM300]NAX24818.1 uroporphyrinogen-III synthase [Vibrio sp. V38_P2S17PM301]NAX31942.1 uroporphyrinogen-III synthase [Vibrio sp. V37_P2S8PM304]
MTVLVTRPAPAGQQLCQQLAQVGQPAIYHPLISIDPGRELSELLTRLPHSDILIAVSQHAAHFADLTLSQNQHPWPTNTLYLAVGQKTAHVLSKATQQKVHYPDISDSEHLLQLPQLQQVQDKKILILRGNGGRELIYDTLTARGAHVHYLEAYQRHNLVFDAKRSVADWQAQQVDTLVVTSAEQLRFLFAQLPAAIQPWVQKQRLLVPSARICTQAHQLGFRHVVNVGGASNNEIMKALQLT